MGYTNVRDYQGGKQDWIGAGFPTVSDLPAAVDCLVLAVAADAACEVLEAAHARGIATHGNPMQRC